MPKPAARLAPSEKPSLESVLDWAGVDFKPRPRQMTSCPLHEDKTPSLSVNLEKQLWNCLSCGEGGDAWTLVEKIGGVDFKGAVKLAASVGFSRKSSENDGDFVAGSAFGRGTRVPRRGRSSSDTGWRPPWRQG